MEAAVFNIWTTRFATTGCLLVNIYVFSAEWRKLRAKGDNYTLLKQIAKYLAVFIFALCIVSSALLLSTTFVELCQFTEPVAIFIAIRTRILLTFFQIVRLQYVFNSKTNVYGYSQFVFIILYLVGSGIFIWGLLWLPYLYPVTIGKYKCFSNRQSLNTSILSLGFAGYLCWDLVVLALYIFKIKRLTKQCKPTKTIYQIKRVLAKIIILTLLCKVTSILIYIFGKFVQSMPHFDQTIFTCTLDVFVTMIVMQLMLDHNSGYYEKIAHFLRKLTIFFCCCKQCLDDEPFVSPQEDKKKTKEITIEVTKSTETTGMTVTSDVISGQSQMTSAGGLCMELSVTSISVTKYDPSQNQNHVQIITESKMNAEVQAANECDHSIDASTTQITTTSEVERYDAINKKFMQAFVKK